MARRKNIEVLGLREVNRELRKAGKTLGLTATEWARLAAKTGIREITIRTQPYGLSPASHEKGKNAVAGDVSRLFFPSESKSAMRFNEMLSYHARNRNRRGRVPKSMKPVAAAAADLRRLRGMLMDHVGKAKASWGGGYEAMGWKLPAWMKPHKTGEVKETRQRGKAFWFFSSGVEYTKQGNVLGERGVKQALASREGRMKTLLNRMMRKAEREAQKRINK